MGVPNSEDGYTSSTTGGGGTTKYIWTCGGSEWGGKTNLLSYYSEFAEQCSREQDLKSYEGPDYPPCVCVK
jgi:hypothetical protein